jgi:hypothetical protein
LKALCEQFALPDVDDGGRKLPTAAAQDAAADGAAAPPRRAPPDAELEALPPQVREPGRDRTLPPHHPPAGLRARVGRSPGSLARARTRIPARRAAAACRL